VTSVVVSHDMTGAFRVADRIALLYDGRIIVQGAPEEFQRSADPLVRQFVTGALEGPMLEPRREAVE
jgi:phospholipid/cholesterol/gamma-HCH transport system ATP-binding protein